MELVWRAPAPAAANTHPPTIADNRPACDTPSSHNAIRDQICYLTQHSVIVCKQHATAVQNLDAHLREHHHAPKKLRREMVQSFQDQAIAQPKDIVLPCPPSQLIAELGAPLAGFQCGEGNCSFITININKLRMHRKDEHGLPWKKDQRNQYRRIPVQTFFRTAGLQRYFEVQAQNSDRAPPTSSKVAEVVKGRLAAWDVTLDEHKKREQVMDAHVAKTDKTGWFKRTGWLEHFADRNLARLAYQARLPDRDEAKLQKAAKLTELLVERSVKGLPTLARETRRWLRSAKRQEIDQRPIARLQNPESQARYAGYMVKFVCYVLRFVANAEVRLACLGGDGEGSNEEEEEKEEEEEEEEDNDENDSSDSSPANKKSRAEAQKNQIKDAIELFCWSDEQQKLAVELWSTLGRNASDDDEALRDTQLDLLLDLLTSFFFTPIGDQLFSSGLVHFLAVLGIDGKSNRLRTAKNYSYMLAGVVYCMRVLSVEKLLPSARRQEQTEADRTRFLAYREKYLADGSYSPMSEALSLLAYGKSVALATGNSGSAYWSSDKKVFYLHGQPIHLDRFCQMAQDLVAEAEQMLWVDLLWVARAEDRFAVKLEKLVDDVSFEQRGASFVQHRDNRLRDKLAWMLKRAEQTTQGRQLQHQNKQWNAKQVKRYLRCVDRFLTLLLLCVHITSGQPGRGSEITTMRHRNGLLQDRNIFVVDGRVMTVVRYHKSQSQWDKPKVVPRFLPPRLGQVMVLYLAYLQPFSEYLTVQVLGGHFSDYVWADEAGPWGTDRLTRALTQETGARLGVSLHTLGYRHTAIGIGRVVVGDAFGKGYQDEVGEVDEAEVDDDGGEDVLELQNARTTAIGVGSYSVPMDVVKHLSVRSIEAFRPLSAMWHRFLGLDGKLAAGRQAAQAGNPEWSKEARKRARDSKDEGARELRSDPAVLQSCKREKALRAAMQQVLGRQEVGFRSAEQELAMHAIVDGQTPLVVVLPTGGGKSLLFSVPACMEEDAGVTVVVVPYRALIETLVSRTRARGIDCVEWKPGESRHAPLVVVSADAAGDTTSDGNFIGYASLLSSQGLLRRVVVDECHLVITSSDWRPKLALLRNLRLLPCPIVLLTATLPPVMESELASSMLLPCATYIRASTVRPDTRYYVSWCERGEAQETALAMCRRQQQQLLGRGEKGVVYCHSKQQCEELAGATACGWYHAGDIDRAERLQQWLQRGGLIVATSALGTGVDFPGVVFILHVGMPWSMIDYAQESGRGGRAGERVDSVVLVERGEVERTMRRKSDDLNVQAMGTFLIGSGCRRGTMSSYLDGKRVECNSISSAGCDWCGEGARGWHDAQREASAQWQQVQAIYDDIRHGCVVCWMVDIEGVATSTWQDHHVMQCTAFPGLTGVEMDRFRRGMFDQGGSHTCRRCWVSQAFCATGEDINKACQWPNTVVPIARAVADDKVGARWIVRRCGYKGAFGDGLKEYAQWLGKRHHRRVWGEYFSNAMVVAVQATLFRHKHTRRQEG